MADKKIPALTAATTPLAGSEVLPVYQGAATVKVSVANLTAGRSTSVSELISDDGVHGRWTITQEAGGNRLYSSTPSFGGWRSAAVQANGTGVNMTWGSDGNTTVGVGNLVIGTAGKGVTTSVANGNVTITPDGTGTTVLAKNGVKIPNNAAVTVGTSATQISVNAVSWSSLAFIFGLSGGDAFSDLVFYADGTAVAVASRTVSGSPAARTYTAPSGQLNLAMASGSYSVFFQHIAVA
jgi:hypothetical protein